MVAHQRPIFHNGRFNWRRFSATCLWGQTIDINAKRGQLFADRKHGFYYAINLINLWKKGHFVDFSRGMVEAIITVPNQPFVSAKSLLYLISYSSVCH